MRSFSDRVEAGRLLASKLEAYKAKPDVTVVALPRGGVPVGFEIAQHLHAPLDVMVVRKLGVPWQPELAMGALASGGVKVLDRTMIRSVKLDNDYFYRLIAREEKEIERQETLFRGGHPAESLSGRTVILVDDGAATGSTMLAAAEAVRKQHPKEIVIAVPVGSPSACRTFKAEVDKCICLARPVAFVAVSQFYKSFVQTTDQEVVSLLSSARLSVRK